MKSIFIGLIMAILLIALFLASGVLFSAVLPNVLGHTWSGERGAAGMLLIFLVSGLAACFLFYKMLLKYVKKIFKYEEQIKNSLENNE